MRRGMLAAVALGLVVGALLGGCAAPEEEGDVLDPGLELLNDRLPDGSTPGFVTEVLNSDPGPDDAPACDFGDQFDLRYSRLQGEYDGHGVYLIATPATDGVAFVTEITEGGCGSSPAGLGAIGSGDPVDLIYVPSGTANVDIPTGWHALSDWIAARD